MTDICVYGIEGRLWLALTTAWVLVRAAAWITISRMSAHSFLDSLWQREHTVRRSLRGPCQDHMLRTRKMIHGVSLCLVTGDTCIYATDFRTLQPGLTAIETWNERWNIKVS